MEYTEVGLPMSYQAVLSEHTHLSRLVSTKSPLDRYQASLSGHNRFTTEQAYL